MQYIVVLFKKNILPVLNIEKKIKFTAVKKVKITGGK